MLRRGRVDRVARPAAVPRREARRDARDREALEALRRIDVVIVVGVVVAPVGARVEEADVAAAEENEEARVQRDDDDLLRDSESVTARRRGGTRRERGTHESRRARDKEGELSRARARLEPAQAARINHVVDGRNCDAGHEGDDEDGRRRDRERPGALELGRDLGEGMNEGDIGRRGDDERPARVGDDAGLICGRETGSASCSSRLERLRERERAHRRSRCRCRRASWSGTGCRSAAAPSQSRT